MKKRDVIMRAGGLKLLLGIIISTFIWAAPTFSATETGPDADQVLQSMSSFLAGSKVFTVNADIDFEIISQAGQKLQLSSFAQLVMERPNKFHVQRQGAFANTEFIFDGQTLTLYGKNLNVYCQMDVPGSIDDAIVMVELTTGLNAPGADLLFSDPYAVLAPEIKRSDYLGTAYVNGVECHHLAFRQAKVDWQLWVRTGNMPLPMKYVITSKWQTAAPQYEIRFRDWQTSPRIALGQFSFKVPEGARKLENMVVDEIGEIYLEEDK